ncbi:MAG: prepilin-type N-terminal cleavage/methylation domain-containing protein [Candidatus Komeilibacteria bacterium]|jgi:prepilin-type N-terminal cleavage/methylation domain-containing protein|nr:prepilin-type N-terminal cleavage/methylation domain-containing protein [Candidatus Komeilibacteria bacterium]MBT4447294.1 prepilin-type N-terminal cleavage/methylation domain-containing protein [Candidatus Komeilibacteria bacterium]
MIRGGFTLIELIIAVGIIALLAAISVVAINPAKRIGQANDSQRNADLVAIINALELYTADNAALPATFAASNVGENHKVVLCSSAAERTCDGQTRDCLVVNDTDFLGEYLADLPVDPEKSTDTDTGYYISRTIGDIVVLGACESYQSTSIEISAKIELAAYTTTCGDGEVEGSEVCDDDNTTTETQTCGNGIYENGTYCNADCSAVITLTEACDYTGPEDPPSSGCYTDPVEPSCKLDYCSASCTACTDLCAS